MMRSFKTFETFVQSCFITSKINPFFCLFTIHIKLVRDDDTGK